MIFEILIFSAETRSFISSLNPAPFEFVFIFLLRVLRDLGFSRPRKTRGARPRPAVFIRTSLMEAAGISGGRRRAKGGLHPSCYVYQGDKKSPPTFPLGFVLRPFAASLDKLAAPFEKTCFSDIERIRPNEGVLRWYLVTRGSAPRVATSRAPFQSETFSKIYYLP